MALSAVLSRLAEQRNAFRSHEGLHVGSPAVISSAVSSREDASWFLDTACSAIIEQTLERGNVDAKLYLSLRSGTNEHQRQD
jgi:hypothetical protein